MYPQQYLMAVYPNWYLYGIEKWPEYGIVVRCQSPSIYKVFCDSGDTIMNTLKYNQIHFWEDTEPYSGTIGTTSLARRHPCRSRPPDHPQLPSLARRHRPPQAP